MSAERETDDRLAPMLEYFAERLNLVFAYYFCVLEFKEDDDLDGDSGKNDRTWVLLTIQTACLHASLIAIRDLDDFLTMRHKGSKPDDLKVSDFGYQTGRSFLSVSERELINKHIAHTTTTGAAAQRFRWDIWELTSKGVAQSMEFLEWVECHYGPSQFLLYTAALACRIKTQKIHDWIAREISKQKEMK